MNAHRVPPRLMPQSMLNIRLHCVGHMTHVSFRVMVEGIPLAQLRFLVDDMPFYPEGVVTARKADSRGFRSKKPLGRMAESP
jgi:hypothetical protein